MRMQRTKINLYVSFGGSLINTIGIVRKMPAEQYIRVGVALLLPANGREMVILR